MILGPNAEFDSITYDARNNAKIWRPNHYYKHLQVTSCQSAIQQLDHTADVSQLCQKVCYEWKAKNEYVRGTFLECQWKEAGHANATHDTEVEWVIASQAQKRDWSETFLAVDELIPSRILA